jgi:hypothetical protein
MKSKISFIFSIVLIIFLLGCQDIEDSAKAGDFNSKDKESIDSNFDEYHGEGDYSDDNYEYNPDHYYYDDNPYNINFREIKSISIPSSAQLMKYQKGKIVMAYTSNSDFEMVNIINPITLEKETILTDTTDLFNIVGVALYDDYIYYVPYGQYMIYRRNLKTSKVENINYDYELINEAKSIAIDENNKMVYVTTKVPGIVIAYETNIVPNEGKMIDISNLENMGIPIEETNDIIINKNGNVYAMLSSSDNDITGDLIKINTNTLSFEKYFDISNIDEWFSQRRMFLSDNNEVIIPQKNSLDQLRFVVIDEKDNINYRLFENYADNYILSNDGKFLLGFVRLNTFEDYKYYLTAYYLKDDNYQRIDDIEWDCKFPNLSSYVSNIALYFENHLYVQCIDEEERYLKKYLLEFKEK